MADISQIKLPNGTTYNIKDANARERIAALESFTTYLGVTTTALTDGATTNPITINNQSVTAQAGNIVLYGNQEFIFDGTHWNQFGDLSSLGTLAYKNTASGSFTPAGTVSQPTFNGDTMNSTGSFTPAGSVKFTNSNKTATVSPSSGTATYTPEGDVSAPTISVKTAGTTTTVNSITAVGTLPTMPTYTVSSEVLTITAGSPGTLPTKGSNQTVKTGDAAYQATAPEFTGTGVRLVTGNISVPSSASFTGTAGAVSVSGTPSGTVSQPTFTGTTGSVTVS